MSDLLIYQSGVEYFNATFKKHYHAAVAEWEKIPHYQPARTALAMCYILGVGRPQEGYGFPQRSQEKLMEMIGISDDVPSLMRELINAYSGTLPYDWSRAKQGMKSSAKRGGDTVVPCIAAYCALEKLYPEFAAMVREERAIEILEDMAVLGYPLATRILLEWCEKQDESVKAKVNMQRICEAAEKRSKVATEQECFLKNAFLFYAATNRIVSDERLSSIPVPFENGLAYTGASGLSNATLGVYVKWWQKYKDALRYVEKTEQNESEPRLLYRIAGSPLSGCNGCAEVNAEGKTFRRVVSPFANAWRSFMEVNKTSSLAEKSNHRNMLTLNDAALILRDDMNVIKNLCQIGK